MCIAIISSTVYLENYLLLGDPQKEKETITFIAYFKLIPL